MKPSRIIAKGIEDFYINDYETKVMSGGLLKRWVVKKTHQEMEYHARKDSKQGIEILELGAQSDQHRSFVQANYKTYIVSDINIKPLLKGRRSKEVSRSNIKFQKIDANLISYPDETFDRLIATCLIVHLDSPIDAMHEWRRVTKDSGRIDIYVPCEPGLILRVARNLTHKRKKLSVDFPFDLLHYSQHKSHYLAINQFMQFIFSGDKIDKRFFPFRFLPFGFNLWAVYSIKINK